MPTQQGDLSLLDDPVAQRLLQSTIPARLAYTWTDGTPRVVPIWFHWNGQEVVFGGPTDAPKMQALHDGAKVAVTIDSDTMPHEVLLLRGTVHVNVVDGVVPEYAAAATRYFGPEQGEAWVEQMRSLAPQMARIVMTPEWAGVIDFQTRFPNAIERAMEAAGAGDQ
jgi:hypothetical protein